MLASLKDINNEDVTVYVYRGKFPYRYLNLKKANRNQSRPETRGTFFKIIITSFFFLFLFFILLPKKFTNNSLYNRIYEGNRRSFIG